MSKSRAASKTKPARPKRKRTDLYLVKSWHSATLLQRVEDGIATKGFPDRAALINDLLHRWCDDIGV